MSNFSEKELINYKGDVNIIWNKNGETPLHMAVLCNNHTIVEKFISQGAVINTSCNRQETALHKAVLEGNEEIVKILLKKGAYVNATNKLNETPLHFAAHCRKKDVKTDN